MNKILITGGDGQLGKELSILLPDAVPMTLLDLDITDKDKVNETVKNFNTVINCAAYTAVDKAESEQDKAFAVNAEGVKNLAIACTAANAELVHISTDYVFSGDATRPYTEYDTPDPQTVYGKSKLLGERYIAEFCKKHYIIRTSWLYGEHGNNFVKTMIRLGREKGKVTVVCDQFGTPTNTFDLARCVEELIQTGKYGLYHGTGNGVVCSWYGFAAEIMKVAGIDAEVIPCKTNEYPTAAKRPLYSVLYNAELQKIGKDCFRNWQHALYYK
jgi:dTDP-4-dehydrorhamnose reductase